MPLIFILYIRLKVFKPLKSKINKIEMRINPVVSIKLSITSMGLGSKSKREGLESERDRNIG